MGNGASLNQRRPSAILSGFRSVEELVARGYFQDNVDAYKAAVEDNIRKEALDILEILVPAGDTRKVLPLHLAASLGRLECCELFLSAGFSPYSTDRKGRTPLHLVATNTSANAGLCATLLVINGPKAVNTRDIEGSSPLHIAAQCGNEPVIRALIAARGVKLNHPNGSGKTAKEIAMSNRHVNIADAIDNASGSSSRGSRTKEVDKERIMQVWERFFENALKACCDEADAAEGLLVMDSHGLKHAKDSLVKSDYMSQWAEFHDDEDDSEVDRRKGGRHRDKEAKVAASFAAMREAVSDSSLVLSMPLSDTFGSAEGECDYRVWDWFCWICCYTLVDAGFYTVNSYDGRTLWLEEFLELQREAGICPGSWTDEEYTEELLHHPTTCTGVVERGWITYFDDSTNDCYWYNLPTGNCERCLPLGWDPSSKRLGLLEYEGSSEWLQCPNSYELRNSWVCVVMSSQYDGQYNDNNVNENPTTITTADAKSVPILRHDVLAADNASDGKDHDSVGIHDGNKHYDEEISTSEAKLSSARSGYDRVASAKGVTHSYSGDAAGDSEAEGSYGTVTQYYLNRLTGHSSWYPPDGWDTTVAEQWCGWILCMSEDSGWALFWWNPETGESVWVEESA